MSCAESRDLYSALVDDVLEAGERARLEAHLGGCGECRRELARFRATVSLLRSVEHLRAPEGFVDRVLAAARPASWLRRALRGLFVPLPLKLPVEAAALVMVAVLGIQLLRHTPEVRQAAYEEAARPAEAPPRASVAEGPTPPGLDRRKATALPPGREALPRKEKTEFSARLGESERQRDDAQQPERALELPSTGQIAERKPSLAPAGERSIPPAAVSSAGEPKAMPAPLSSMAQDLATAEADVIGALAVTNRDAAERALATLVVRLGAAMVARRADGGVVVVEVLVPRAQYAEFVRELKQVGGWAPDSEPAELPGRVRVRLRITG